jgi:hypothetical protein
MRRKDELRRIADKSKKGRMASYGFEALDLALLFRTMPTKGPFISPVSLRNADSPSRFSRSNNTEARSKRSRRSIAALRSSCYRQKPNQEKANSAVTSTFRQFPKRGAFRASPGHHVRRPSTRFDHSGRPLDFQAESRASGPRPGPESRGRNDRASLAPFSSPKLNF